MSYFISARDASYYEGDRVHILDAEVPQRPSLFYDWNGSAWVINQTASDAAAARIAREAAYDAEALVTSSVIDRLRTATPTQIRSFATGNAALNSFTTAQRTVLGEVLVAIGYALRGGRDA